MARSRLVGEHVLLVLTKREAIALDAKLAGGSLNCGTSAALRRVACALGLAVIEQMPKP